MFVGESVRSRAIGSGYGRAETAPIVELVDFSGVEPVAKTLWPGPRRDYVSPGLVDPGLLRHFPSLEEGDVADLQWPYLRKDAPHIWRRDLRSRRNPYIGVLSLDEATLLHNNALPFRGKRGLEIGCHYALVDRASRRRRARPRRHRPGARPRRPDGGRPRVARR